MRSGTASAHRALRDAWKARIAGLGSSSPRSGLPRPIAERPEDGLREHARRSGTDPMNAGRIADGLATPAAPPAGGSPDG